MKYLSAAVLIIAFVIISLITITSLKRQLSDCRFEVNHLQVRLYRLQELSDYISAMEQPLMEDSNDKRR